jgi:hypothetical protein
MKYTTLEANLEENRLDILPIWTRNLLRVVDSEEDKFAWYYQKNPLGRGQCWLLHDQESSQFVGTAGLGLRKFKVFNEVVEVGLLADFAVDERHRNFFAALMLQRKVQEALDSGLGFLYSTPHRASAGVQLRLGHIKLGEMERYARILDTGPYLRRVSGNWAGARAIASPMNAILRALSRDTWQSEDKEFVVKEMEEFDSRFDALWERAAPGFAVTGERTSKFLRWRYAQFPGRKHFIVALLSRNEEKLFGYVIFSAQENIISIADLFFEVPDKLLSNLLTAFLHLARRGGATSVSFSFLGPEAIKRKLKAFGFYPRSDKMDLIIDVGTKNRLPPAIFDPSQWYFVPGDQEY